MNEITHKYSLEFVEAVSQNIKSAFYTANSEKDSAKISQALSNAYLFAKHIRDFIDKGETDFDQGCEKIAQSLEKL
jgi:hypothetical protein